MLRPRLIDKLLQAPLRLRQDLRYDVNVARIFNRMELTWLADTPQSRSRTRALRACPACQRRKVRGRDANPVFSAEDIIETMSTSDGLPRAFE